MSYPPSSLSSRTDSSAAVPSSHAADHTAERDAINDIVTELGATPKGAYTDLSDRLTAMAAASGASILAYVQYWPAGGVNTTPSGLTLQDLDAAHLSITFTAPASGNVVVELEALGTGLPGDSALFWGVRESSSVVADLALVATPSASIRTRVRFLITGLTPSSSHTYKWAHATSYSGGHGITSYGDISGPASMCVTAAP